jgi:ankyrin repeat protein
VNLLTSPDDGVTVLHDAVVNNHLAVVKLLAQAGGEYF